MNCQTIYTETLPYRRDRQAELRLQNREDRRAYSKTYRKTHRAELTEYQRRYRATHPEQTRQQWRRDSARYRLRKRNFALHSPGNAKPYKQYQ